ncbi:MULTISPECIES: hypothetical protein [unclassified Salinibacterium]|uniref:hypothetical protein n=1 Tax=unclassified Salinibacterium TaxID=2632331 RepID=UPI00141DE723|nr:MULTISPECIES: hypothetical protein [unclassified Salinibacterium]
MQLGTRWSVGDEPPARLPADMVEAVRAVEAEVSDIDTSAWRWTLTFLEGRPVAELDDGTVLRMAHDGTIQREQLD